MAWKEYYSYNIENLSLDAGAGTVFEETTIKTDTDADFELVKRTHVATSDKILARFKDDAYGRNFQNAALDIRDISGAPVSDISVGSVTQHKGHLGFILPRPILIRAATTYTAEFADNSGLANSVRMSLHGSKIRPGKAPWDEPWRARPSFDYTSGLVTIAANSTAVVNIPINIDAHFLIHKITATRTGPLLVTVKDGATDRQWMDRAVHIDNFAGNAHYPNILPAFRFIYKGSVISVALQDLSGASNEVRINFHGEKLFL